VEAVAAKLPVKKFHRCELNHAVPKVGFKAGGFGIENDLPRHLFLKPKTDISRPNPFAWCTQRISETIYFSQI
jgi:hypothetical protein